MATRGRRRFSQAIAEGDGISVIVAVTSAEDARRAEGLGADAVLVDGPDHASLPHIRAATALPILLSWDGRQPGALDDADACLVEPAALEDPDRRARVHETVGECELVLRIDEEEELAWVLEELDPEIVLLAASRRDREDALEHVLELLPDLPAGKLAIAEAGVTSREHVAELERAGVDGVLVSASAQIAELVGAAPPEL